jgi:carboxyl-terminal processing protease
VTIALSPGGPGSGFERPRAEKSAGIGVQFWTLGDALRIEGIVPGSGAEAAGLARGDLIIAIDGVPVAGMGGSGATDRIRGVAGTRVTLTIRRNGEDVQRSVERRPLPS